MSPALTATVKTRREQLMAYHDERALEIAKRFATGKLRNQMNVLKYFAKYRKKAYPVVFAASQEIVEKICEVIRRIHRYSEEMGRVLDRSECANVA